MYDSYFKCQNVCEKLYTKPFVYYLYYRSSICYLVCTDMLPHMYMHVQNRDQVNIAIRMDTNTCICLFLRLQTSILKCIYDFFKVKFVAASL